MSAEAGRSSLLTGQPLLEVSGLCVDYGVGPGTVHAVVGADLVLHHGEVLGLAGESGSGKSTLAYAITRLLRAPGMIIGGSVAYRPRPGSTVDLLAADEGALRVLRWSQISVVLQSAMNALNPDRGRRTCPTWWASATTGCAATRMSCLAACGRE